MALCDGLLSKTCTTGLSTIEGEDIYVYMHIYIYTQINNCDYFANLKKKAKMLTERKRKYKIITLPNNVFIIDYYQGFKNDPGASQLVSLLLWRPLLAD